MQMSLLVAIQLLKCCCFPSLFLQGKSPQGRSPFKLKWRPFQEKRNNRLSFEESEKIHEFQTNTEFIQEPQGLAVCIRSF